MAKLWTLRTVAAVCSNGPNRRSDDRLRDAYRRRLGADADALRPRASHCRARRALIAGDEANHEGLRTERIAALARSGLEVACLGPRRRRGDGRTARHRRHALPALQRARRQSRRLALFELADRLVARGDARVTARVRFASHRVAKTSVSELRRIWAAPRLPPPSARRRVPLAYGARVEVPSLKRKKGVVEFRR